MTETPADEAARDRAHGLLLFDAEESLARGEAEKALVLASRAVKERPDNFTARAILERARRELTRGKRRERLEAKVAQAEAMFAAGDFAAAEKIVTSALKLIPDHAAALGLFGKLRDRPRVSAAEAEADRELAGLAQAQASKALDSARASLAAGWERTALVHVRRGLRHVPDHAGLLALLRELQGETEGAEGARRRALLAQVRAGLELLAEGETDASLRILRAVLREDPEHVRAQAAVQEVRRAILARAAPRVAPPPPPKATGAAAPPVRSPAAAPSRPVARPAPLPQPNRDLVTDASLPFVPVEILLPLTRRHRTPTKWIAAGAGLVVGIVLLLAFSGRGLESPPSEATAVPSIPPGTQPRRNVGPLEVAPADLRATIETTLLAYTRALERGDATALAAARPDLTAAAQRARLGPFVGALNAATDVRVLDVVVTGDRALVPVLSTDVIVGGRGAPRASTEETLVFERRQGAWRLEPAGR